MSYASFRNSLVSGLSVFARRMTGRHENMANRKPLTDDDGEVRELAAEDFARMVPFSGLPKELQELLSQPKTIRPEPDEETARHSAA